MACTSEDVRGLTPAQLVVHLESTTWECLTFLFETFDADLESVLSETHVTAVFDRIAAQSPAYTGDNQQHLLELLAFAHAAYFQQFYNSSNPRVFAPMTVQPATEAAFGAFAASQYFHAANEMAGRILYEWVTGVDSAMLGHRYYDTYVAILQTFNLDPSRLSQSSQNAAIYATFRAINRQIDENAAFRASVTQSLLTELSATATNTGLPEYLPSNAIFTLEKICQHVPAWKSAAVRAITDARSAWPRLSAPWLWTVDALTRCNACLDATGARLCKNDVLAEISLPRTFSFDDGALIVRTGLDLSTAESLYLVVKTVEAQFHRLTQTIAPLPGDPTDVLTMVVFRSPADYVAYAPPLFGIPTRNGGIYLEPQKTLYTFARTELDSIFPLEELVRHEYAHYLIGRFLIPGMWNATPIYRSDRLLWFEEGLAEFLTWSTTGSGIRPRQRLVGLVQQHGLNRMTVRDVLSVRADGDFRFYSYAALLFSYWYEYDLGTIFDLLDLVRDGNLEGYDLTIEALKSDAPLQTAYDQYLVSLINTYSTLTDPSTTVPPLARLDLTTTAQVQARVRSTRIGYMADCTVAATETLTRFSARGVLSGQLGTQRNLVAAWRVFNDNLDEVIANLVAEGSNNFTALTARFGRIRWVEYGSGQSYPMADYFLEGPLPHGVQPLLAPVQQVTADFRSTRFGVNVQVAASGPTQVRASLSLTTAPVVSATPRTTLLLALEDARLELRNQVYAIRPSYYRSLEVSWDGSLQIIPYTNGQRYGLRNVLCTIDFA